MLKLNNLSRIVFGLGLGFVLFQTIVFANDCYLVEGTVSDQWIGTYDNLYPQDAREQALTNLQAYCCEQIFDETQKLSSCEGKIFPDYYPESPYLYDHLVDVGLRRLDVVASYGLSPDVKGSEWRQEIEELAVTPDGDFASSVSNVFKDYWFVDNPDYSLGFASFDDVSTIDDAGVELQNNNYVNASMYQRYMEQCGIAFVLKKTVQNGLGSLDLEQQNFLDCQTMVSARIQSEFNFVRSLVLLKSNKLLTDNMHSYMYDYFSKIRLVNLQETVFQISDLFMTIAKSVPSGTPECN